MTDPQQHPDHPGRAPRPEGDRDGDLVGGLLGAEPVADPVEERYRTRGGSRRAAKRGRGIPGCLAVLVALAVIGGGLWWGADRGIEAMRQALNGSSAEDYPGPGTGEVVFEVKEGDTAAQIGRNLKAAGVVASVDAFIQAANANPESAGIQVGFYTLRQEMRASDALEVLIDPGSIVTTAVTIPEGLRLVDILDRLAEATRFPRARFEAALGDPSIGLPEWADGNAEGYLYPATYTFPPNAEPVDMVKQMVDRWRQAAEQLELEAKAGSVSEGYTPQEIMTVASLAQNEGKTAEDMARIARVIYNRIENPAGGGGTGGLLQIDATVDYALDRPLTVGLTQEERETTESPYNTFLEPGLPPGPISSPGDAAIEAALNPAEGDWYYYITVNLATGETKFAETYDEFLTYNNELDEYCETESAGAC